MAPQHGGEQCEQPAQGELLAVSSSGAEGRRREPPTAEDWARYVADARTRAAYEAKVYVRGPDQCWPWIGSISETGHGNVKAAYITADGQRGTSRTVLAHVYGWCLAHGAPPPTVVRHGCDFAACQNPAHWEAGTVQQNTAEYYARRGVGGDHPLSDRRGAAGRAVAVREAIKAARAAGATAAQIEAAIWAAYAAGVDGTQGELF